MKTHIELAYGFTITTPEVETEPLPPMRCPYCGGTLVYWQSIVPLRHRRAIFKALIGTAGAVGVGINQGAQKVFNPCLGSACPANRKLGRTGALCLHSGSPPGRRLEKPLKAPHGILDVR
ncbi:MAG TPA: hypothetical protein VHH93_05055 [Gammaproteobacteria bacterium]|nr:hypothetical protein [Gammaproteobacteria bacterium]